MTVASLFAWNEKAVACRSTLPLPYVTNPGEPRRSGIRRQKAKHDRARVERSRPGPPPCFPATLRCARTPIWDWSTISDSVCSPFPRDNFVRIADHESGGSQLTGTETAFSMHSFEGASQLEETSRLSKTERTFESKLQLKSDCLSIPGSFKTVLGKELLYRTQIIKHNCS